MSCKHLLFIVIGFVLVASAGPDYLAQTDEASSEIRLSVRSAKLTYTRGEIVKLTVLIENRRSEKIGRSIGSPGENTATKFYVSRDGGATYGEYNNRQWAFNGTNGYVQIETGASHDETFDILWNLKPDIAGRSPMGVENAIKGKILTDYTFPLAGTYRVKAAVWNLRDANRRQLPILESEPIEIRVVEPQGVDLIVWRLIENRPDLAYFIQNAWFRDIDTATRERLWREMREIADRYPNSVIARQIGRKLQEFRTKWRKPLPWESTN